MLKIENLSKVFRPENVETVALVTLLTVTIQGWRAATENPINSIKTE